MLTQTYSFVDGTHTAAEIDRKVAVRPKIFEMQTDPKRSEY